MIKQNSDDHNKNLPNPPTQKQDDSEYALSTTAQALKGYMVENNELPFSNGVKEYGVGGIINEDSKLKIIGPWKLLVEKDNRALFGPGPNYTHGDRAKLFLHVQQGVELTFGNRERTDSEEDVFKKSNGDKEKRPNSRIAVTKETIASIQDNIPYKDPFDMMQANYQDNPSLFNEDMMKGNYPLQYARGFGLENLIDKGQLEKNAVEEQYSEYANYGWIMDGIQKSQPFLLAFELNEDELGVLTKMVDEVNNYNGVKKIEDLLEYFAVEIKQSAKQTLQSIKEHYSAKNDRYTAHISGLIKPNDANSFALTGTGKEIIFLLQNNYKLLKFGDFHYLIPFTADLETLVNLKKGNENLFRAIEENYKSQEDCESKTEAGESKNFSM